MLEKVNLNELGNGLGFDIHPMLRINLYEDAQLFDQNGSECKRLVNEIIM